MVSINSNSRSSFRNKIPFLIGVGVGVVLFAGIPSGVQSVSAYLEFPTDSSGISRDTGLPVTCPDTHPISSAVADFIRGNFIVCYTLQEYCGANPSYSQCSTTSTTTPSGSGGGGGSAPEPTLAAYPTSNPFPGVAYGSEVPGFTVTVPCLANGDCGIGIVPVVQCPSWSAGDGTDGYATGVAKRFCRASWTPPTTYSDEQDFKNQQELAIAEATLKSQQWNAAHPGLQKCFQWGPVIHKNGISTANGGVCANPFVVEGSEQSATMVPSDDGSRYIDLTRFGIGKPFTKVIRGSKSINDCPDDFKAASNPIAGVDGGATECWPQDAFSAWNSGGSVWSNFKISKQDVADVEKERSTLEINRIRASSLIQAQKNANTVVGAVSCVDWNYLGQINGRECAFVPLQSNVGMGSSGAKSALASLKNVQITEMNSESKADLSAKGSRANLRQVMDLAIQDESVIRSIDKLLNSVEMKSKVTLRSGANLPDNPELDVEIRSLSAKVCDIYEGKLKVKKSGLCNVEYTVNESDVDFILQQKIKVKK